MEDGHSDPSRLRTVSVNQFETEVLSDRKEHVG